MQPTSIPAPRRTRRWRVPPPLTRGGELLEGGAVLTETSGETAILLWKTLRNVTLWAEATPAEAAELFAPSAHPRRLAEIAVAPLDGRLREALEALAGLLADPTETPREAVALACRRVAAWAEARGAAGTALLFQQAAAMSCPGDARMAYEVGRLARQNGEMARAESWYRRAVMLGRQTRDWYSYARAYLGLGNLLLQRGSLPAARRVLTKGLRAAKRHSLQPITAMAHHDLFMVGVDSCDYEAARRHAGAALKAYPPRHPRLPALAHDIACFWTELGDFRSALPVFGEVLKHTTGPNERVVVLGNIARAAGGAGDAQAFAIAREQLLRDLPAVDGHAAAAQALLNLARGGETIGRWDEAQQAARDALETAASCGAAQIIFQAEAVLSSVERCLLSGQTPTSPSPGAKTEEDELVRELAASLQSA